MAIRENFTYTDMDLWLNEKRVTEIECLVPDLTGVARGKILPRGKFTQERGMRIPEAVLGMTVTGNYPVDDGGYDRAISSTDRDMILKADPTTITMVPWATDPTAQVIHDCYFSDGALVDFAPRSVLRRVLKLYADKGWKPVVAPELEFYLTAKNMDPDLPLKPPIGRSGTVFIAENVQARLRIDDALVHVHGGTRFARHGLGHEGGVHIVFQGRFAQGALEEKHLVGQAQRVAVQEVDFHLPRADFVDQGIDVQVHQLAIIVDILEQRVELVDGVDAVHLAAGLGPAAASDGRLQGQVRVAVLCRQVELQLGRHHGLPALVRIQFQHAPQDGAGREIDQHAV